MALELVEELLERVLVNLLAAFRGVVAIEQHFGLDVLCLAMHFRFGEQAGKAAENLQEGGHG